MESLNLNKIFKACGFDKVDEKLVQDINKIVDWQEVLKEVNIDNVEPMFHTLGENAKYMSNEDEVVIENTDVLSNAPDKEDNFFLVPKVIKN